MTWKSPAPRASRSKIGLAAVLCLAASASAQQAQPGALFVLGDSLSDVGNAAALVDFAIGRVFAGERAVGLCNPADVLVLERGCEDVFYHGNRVSDGPVAVEHLAAHLGMADLAPSRHPVLERSAIGTNYAVASAKARGTELEDLGRQTDMLVLDHGPLLPADALFVVMIGGNDAIDALQAQMRAGGSRFAAAATAAAAVGAIQTAVRRLLHHGARRLIVANVPDLATLPAIRAAAQSTADPTATLAAASAVSAALNAQLDAALDALSREHAAAAILRFDLAAALETTLAAAARAGVNTHDACFDSAAYRASPSAERTFHPDCAGLEPAHRFSSFSFWDALHPSGALHAELGRALIELYERAL